MPASIDPALLIGAALVVVAALAFASLRRVPQGFAYTLERFGRFRRVLAPGLAVVMPLADRIGARLDVRERAMLLPRADLLTRDRIPVRAEVTAFYQIVDAARAAYEVDDLDATLRALLSTSLRTLVGARDLETVLGDRAALNKALLEAVDDAAAVWGVNVARTEVGELSPPDELVLASRNARETELQRAEEIAALEGERRMRRSRAEAEQEALLADARSRSELARLEAEMQERVAEGDARATLMLSRALQEGDVRALNYLLARQYVDALKTLAVSDNGRFVILPLETGGVAASLTGIRELAEATFPDLADEEAAERAERAETQAGKDAEKDAEAQRTAAGARAGDPDAAPAPDEAAPSTDRGPEETAASASLSSASLSFGGAAGAAAGGTDTTSAPANPPTPESAGSDAPSPDRGTAGRGPWSLFPPRGDGARR